MRAALKICGRFQRRSFLQGLRLVSRDQRSQPHCRRFCEREGSMESSMACCGKVSRKPNAPLAAV